MGVLLAATQPTARNSAISNVATNAYQAFIGIVNIVLPLLIGVVLALGLFYGIQLAVKYAKAEEEEDKKKAKGNLINVIVGCLIAIVFVAIILIVLNGSFIEELFGNAVTNTNVGQGS